MNQELKERFLTYCKAYFKKTDLPLAAYYTDESAIDENNPSANGRCLIENLITVRNGTPLKFASGSIGCPGGLRYAGFTQKMGEDFAFFLSYGIPGKFDGERYKKSPELVRKTLQEFPQFVAPKKYLVIKRWDQLTEWDEPEIIIFLARSDVISGLFTLANYDVTEEAVVAPFGSGCSSIIMHPYLESKKPSPRCVLGMFDPSARPHMDSNHLSFSVPMNRFLQMIKNMPESFLITPTWSKIMVRIK